MHTILRALTVYLVLLTVFRISGKRSLGQVTTFDFVILLIIGDSVQPALLGDDYSVTNAVLVVLTLIGADILLSLLKQRSRPFDRLVEGRPLILVQDGLPLQDRMNMSRVDEEDIMEAARKSQGLERMDQIHYAVLERSGEISIIPART